MDLSVIYPVHITYATRYILKRITRCLSNTTQGLPEAEHVIALSGKPRYIKQAKQLINTLNYPIQVIDYTTPTTPYSPGIARNFAVEHATTKHLLFWDIDLLGSPQLYDAIPGHIEHIQDKHNAFEMYPCLYLCQEYTKGFKGESKQDFDQAWTDATNLKVNSIEHFALATSTILCNKQHFLDIGAFDEDFIGHMGEDLELLNRLSISYSRHKLPCDYLLDTPDKNPSNLKGFRAHFACYSIPHLKNNFFSLHVHHRTRLSSKYKNNKNINLLYQKMTRSISNNEFKEHGFSTKTIINSESYLSYTPTLYFTLIERIKRKGKKLLRNPRKFIKDIKTTVHD